MAATIQRFWADNQVSCTVTFDPLTEGKDLKNALDFFQYQLKGISFLPRRDKVYPQMPYEEITKQEYLEKAAKLKPINVNSDHVSFDAKEPQAEKFCDGDTCTI